MMLHVYYFLQNIGTTQAQFDLLQSFTEVAQSSEGQLEVRATSAGLQCGYCNKTFKTTGGLNRHVSLVRLTKRKDNWDLGLSVQKTDTALVSKGFTKVLSVMLKSIVNCWPGQLA